jgi:hypothetical protein
MRASKGELATGSGSEVATTEGASCGVGDDFADGDCPTHPTTRTTDKHVESSVTSIAPP